ncbi:hypothetical protein RhiirA5_434130 [Rhizophagus irregularis]|uniref:RNase H type-1 domain-containing protein n=1 Tax=Rhizophagus irregularis TaxID=588596 RepID=A0A2N0NQJ8_9GLOM|nr:hypothetical protein RhiirA5_434130 [Rhizophagus irregularis]
MYIDQLVSLDGNYLLTWDEVKRHNNNNFKGQKPKWFTLLEDEYTLILGRPQKYNKWTYYWNTTTQNCIIGKTNSSITIMEHFVPVNNSLLSNTLPNNSPRSLHLILIPCPGCHLNDHTLTSFDVRIKCTISIRTNKLSTFKVYHHTSSEHKKFKNIPFKKYFVSTKPLHSIRHSAHSIYLAHHNINIPLQSTPTLSLTSLSNQNNSLKQITSVIQFALNCSHHIKSSLIDIASQFSFFTNFQFYSDGSVSDIGTIHSRSGFGWLQTDQLIPNLSFNGSTIYFPSSFKSESLAILTILLVLPPYATSSIYTDSQNCIDTFNQRIGSPVISPRRRLKQNNFLIWDLIIWLISHYHLTIQLLKVKAHSNNKCNDQANALAKMAKYKKRLIELIQKENNSSFTFDIAFRINDLNLFKLLPDVLDSALNINPDDPTLISREQPFLYRESSRLSLITISLLGLHAHAPSKIGKKA